MKHVLKSLDVIAPGYSIFEKDQVLTHDQLNSVTEYLDDQSRLTRVKLIGIGIGCGLRATLKNNQVTVSKGVGITSDGDLLYFDADRLFDRFKVYDESNPIYAPFYVGGTMLKLYELVAKGESDTTAKPLSQFSTLTGASLNNMVALLLMESYANDPDICTGTDCDNLGMDYISKLKLLLIDKASVGNLTDAISTPHDVFDQMASVTVNRPRFSAAISSYAKLAEVYANETTTVHEVLTKQLSKIYPLGKAFLGDEFSADPGPAWEARLKKIRDSFVAQKAVGIQYYYDFLKDLAETYNSFADALFGALSVCCPRTDSFAKHLLLGNLVPSADPDENRTRFYPSPLIAANPEQVWHVVFLARKINTMITAFALPKTEELRITPSHFENQALEARAIPYYYAVSGSQPMHRDWSYRLSRRGMADYNYGYHAPDYSAKGGAASPLTTQLGAYDFFRIEGHLGMKAGAALDALDELIKENNLPIAVMAVQLGADRKIIPKRPGPKYSDLHRFHYLLRQDLYHQMDEADTFGKTFKFYVDDAVSKGVVRDEADSADGPTVKKVAEEKQAAVSSNAASVKEAVNKPYSQYRTNTTWKSALSETTKAGGEFKYNLGKVVKTEFATPFDNLISNTHILWIDWLDKLIVDKEEKEEEKVFFTNFISVHPGVEHFAGVTRGGTFVLVYDTSAEVVADFMLPYYCGETLEDEAEEKTLPKPNWRPDLVIKDGIKVLASRDKFIQDKLVVTKGELIKEWGDKLTYQDQYINVFKDTVELMGKVYNTVDVAGAPAVAGSGKYTDAYLGMLDRQANSARQRYDYAKGKAVDPTTPEDKRTMYEEQAKAAEKELVGVITQTANYVAKSGHEVTAGSEGYQVMMSAAGNMTKVTNAEANTLMTTGLTEVMNTATDANLKLMLNNMLNIRR